MKELPKNIHLIVIGKDRKARKLQLESVNSRTSDRVHFLGAQQNLQNFYQAADLFLFPTLYDPLPNVVLEAMASGLPALVSNSCGAREVVTEGVDGTIQDPLDLDHWRDATLKIVEDEERKKLIKMSYKAREKALQFGINNMVDKLSTLYRES
jgi:UDP-glucose:(heptosyl)LPS alpha-1,3-glucosyltransferase